MKPGHLSGVYKIRDVLAEDKVIPTTCREALEERLPIYCNTFTRQRPGKGRTNQEYKARQRSKKAHNVYIEVSEIDPHILLPFMIHISPAACRAFDVSTFRRQHNNRRGIFLGNYAKELLQDIASRKGVSTCPRFITLMSVHFPRAIGQTQPPPTGAEISEKWGFDHFTLDFIRDKFGENILKAVERSPIREVEMSKGAIKLTNCARINFPEWPGQDAIVWFDIGMATEVASILFPRTSPEVLPFLAANSTERPSACQSQGRATSVIEEGTPVTMRGASINAVPSVVSKDVCDAIETSQLRIWEKDHQIFDTTDCVKLQVWRNNSHRGIICLRIEFKLAMDILNSEAA